MHGSVSRWVLDQVRMHSLADLSTLEVGSLDVNGSVREFFHGEYVGIDMRDGKGVDKVMNAHALEFPDESFECVVSTEMLEHDEEFWVSVREMGRVLKTGGYLVLTARGNGFQEHGFPEDYYRFMPSAFHKLITLAGCDVLEVVNDPEAPGLFGVGRKR